MSIIWSYSSLGLFQQCPRKYHALRVEKSIVEPETEAMLYGKVVHKAFEDYIQDGKPLPKYLEPNKPILDMLNELPGTKLCEYKMGLTKDLQPCDFFDKENVWFRGVADLVIIDGENARVIDYKTGKSSKYADTKQLELMALAIFKHFPEVKKVKAGLIFVVSEDFIPASYVKDDAPHTWVKWLQETDRLEKAYEVNVWNAKPNFTCRKHCLVKDCEHNGKGHYR